MISEISTWYDTWNQTGADNLAKGLVPLSYANRYNLAFGSLAAGPAGFSISYDDMPYASGVLAELRRQAPAARIHAGLGSTGLVATVRDNEQHGNRSTANIVRYLREQGLQGITIDAEDRSPDGSMANVVPLLGQLGPSFRDAGLAIAVSVPWPGAGPVTLYGPEAVAAFNTWVDAVEMQDYSSAGTAQDAGAWIGAGVRGAILMGGVATENGQAQTSLEDTVAWTRWALANGLRGMSSWRLDNDHGRDGTQEDVEPTFTGARAIYETARAHAAAPRPAGVPA